VRLAGCTVPIAIQVRFVGDWQITGRYTEGWTVELLQKIPYALSMVDALNRLAERQAGFANRVLASVLPTEPAAFKRKIGSRILPPDDGPAPSPAERPQG